MEPIEIVESSSLRLFEKEAITKIAEEHYGKIKRQLKNDLKLKIHLKKHFKGGKSTNYEVLLRVIAPTRVFEAKESDWELPRALHKVFENAMHEIQHRLHTDENMKRIVGK